VLALIFIITTFSSGRIREKKCHIPLAGVSHQAKAYDVMGGFRIIFRGVLHFIERVTSTMQTQYTENTFQRIYKKTRSSGGRALPLHPPGSFTHVSSSSVIFAISCFSEETWSDKSLLVV